MSDELSSIVEFSEDIETAEAPNPLPPGEYIGEVIEANNKVSNNNKLYCAVTFIVSADQYPPDYKDGNPDGTFLTYRRVPLEDNVGARFTVSKFCNALGLVVNKSFDANALVGHRARLTVTNEMYNDLMRANVAKVESVE